MGGGGKEERGRKVAPLDLPGFAAVYAAHTISGAPPPPCAGFAAAFADALC